ncbi:uncharacterized protein LOC132280027 [Cornus florida]|uniref:uncharacterized protein LOC132280027 n=1 Tax=Cornus florida TaxID=4283 RepID=UPI00289DDB72|nr:uncharacterized protein LOC132280027 [Cornus florida]
MTTKGREEAVVFYAPIPPHPVDDQTYVLLPLRTYRTNRHDLRRCLGVATFLLLFVAAAYLLYPSDPDLTLVRLHLNNIQVHASPQPSLDVSLFLTLRVFNRDFFSLNYSSLVVSIGYRGRELGFVTSNGGHLRARGSSYVNATLELNGFQVIHDVFYLLEDLARGSIPFDTHSKVKGTVGLFFIQVPIQARISCEVIANTTDQTIIRQDCYPQ